MARKGFNFNRSLNENLAEVENVFDDLTKPSLAKQQNVETKDSNLNTSDIVTDINSNNVSTIEKNISSTIISNKKSNIINNVNASIASNMSSTIESSIVSKIPSIEQNIVNTKVKEHSLVDEKKNISVRDLSRFHTEAEQKVYRILYNQTIALNRNNWYFSFNELAKKTGFKSKITIATAIEGLAAKKSIDVLTDKRGDHLGKRYKVYTPTEIVSRREQENVNIDPQTKKVIES